MRRVLAFPLVRLVLIVVVFGVFVTPVVFAARAPHTTWRDVALNWILVALLLAAIGTVERFTVGKSLAAIGLAARGAVQYLGLGAALGAALFSLVVLELALGGFYRIVAMHPTRDLAIAAFLLFPGAAAEEVLFRGVIFRLVQEWSGTWIALGVSAAIFGFAHAANPGATWISTLAIALEAGVLLGAAYVATRSLWFPIGLHFAWNFFEGPIFGTQVSGRVFLTNALTARVSGPSILTGGAFGPEAGLFAIVTCLVAAVGLLAYARRRSLIRSPAWKKPLSAAS